MKNGNVYYYRAQSEQGKITKIEYGSIFKKTVEIRNIDVLKDKLLKNAQLIDPSYNLFESSTNYKLKINGEEHCTGADLYIILLSYMTKEL